MSNYSSNLKTWGATGSEFPDGYSYVAGEQPVDDWDNFKEYNTLSDLFHLIDLTNERLESDSGSSYPSSPEPGHVAHRTDGVVTTDEELFFYDSTNKTWHRLMQADGDKMTGDLDTGGNNITDSAGDVTIEGPSSMNGAAMEDSWYRKYEGGTLDRGTAVPMGTFNLSYEQTLSITQATLTKDGFTTPASTGIELMIVPDGSANVSVLAGDGQAHYDEVTGSPVASYTNTAETSQTVMIALDNGEYSTGVGSNEPAFAGYIARKE